MWNHAKKSMEELKLPYSVFLQGDGRSSVLKTLKTTKTRKTKKHFFSSNFSNTMTHLALRLVLAKIKEPHEHYFGSLFVINFPCFQNQIDPIMKLSVRTAKKIARKGRGRTTIQCRSYGWAEITVLISRQRGYWKPTILLLFLAIQSALPLEPQNMTESSLMWPWPVRMVSWWGS